MAILGTTTGNPLEALITQLSTAALGQDAATSDANNLQRNQAASRQFMQATLPQLTAASHNAGTSGSAMQALLVQNGADNAAANAALSQGQLANQAESTRANFMASQLSSLNNLNQTVTNRDTNLANQANQFLMNAANNQTSIANTFSTNQANNARSAAHDASQSKDVIAQLANSLQINQNDVANRLAIAMANNAGQATRAQQHDAAQATLQAGVNATNVANTQSNNASQLQLEQLRLAQQARSDQSAAAVAAAHDVIAQAMAGATNTNNLEVQKLKNQGVLNASGNGVLNQLLQQAQANQQNNTAGWAVQPTDINQLANQYGVSLNNTGTAVVPNQYGLWSPSNPLGAR